jgi:hypothetical protein
MNTRLLTAGILAAAALVAAPSAHATPVQRPDSAAVVASQAALRDTVQRLLEEGRHASTVAQSRLIHRDLIQTVREGE